MMLGMGQPSSTILPVTATVAPPTFAVLNMTKQADATNGYAWNAGDSYRVLISNVGQNLPVSLNGTVVGNTGQAGFYQYDGTIPGSGFSQAWSVPAGTYGSGQFAMNIPGFSQSYAFSVGSAGGGAGPAPTSSTPSTCFSLINKLMTGNSDTSPCIGPASQITWALIAGGGLLAYFLIKGEK